MIPTDLSSFRRIPLTQGQFALVDAEDYAELSKHKWRAAWSPCTRSFYAVRSVWAQDRTKWRTGYMHRQLLGVADPKIHVDHIHHDTLDNRRSELRVTTSRANNSNRKGKTTGKYSSRFVGVSWSKRDEKWEAHIWTGEKSRFLGCFVSEEEAAAAYQDALTQQREH